MSIIYQCIEHEIDISFQSIQKLFLNWNWYQIFVLLIFNFFSRKNKYFWKLFIIELKSINWKKILNIIIYAIIDNKFNKFEFVSRHNSTTMIDWDLYHFMLHIRKWDPYRTSFKIITKLAKTFLNNKKKD